MSALRRRASGVERTAATLGLLAIWSWIYRLYRADGKKRTEIEWHLLRTSTPEAFSRHYNECVPTVEEELDMWGDYHGHRHQMRYRLVGEKVRELLPPGGAILDVGCGAALVAEEVADLDGTYVGIEYGGHQLDFAAAKRVSWEGKLRLTFVRGDAEHLPFIDRSFDLVVMSEVIEHLLRPEVAVWEIARVLRPGGIFVMTTNNASELPLRSPTSHLFAWLEKAIGFHNDRLISYRPWIWPEPVAKAILPEGSSDVYVPHTWHKQAETRRMFAAAGLETIVASSFEFPPPQSATAAWLDTKGAAGRRAVDALEAVCQQLPLVNRLGCHLFMVARRVEGGMAEPPPGIWPGPFSRSAAA